MKALFEKVTIGDQRSLLVRQFRLPYFDAPWHYHPEYELTYIISGYGHRFVGDHVALFRPGDLVLLGPDLPHFWRCDADFYESGSDRLAESIVVQFRAALVDTVLAHLPEAGPLCAMLRRGQHGLRFSETCATQLAPLLTELIAQTRMEQLMGLLRVLTRLTTDPDAQPLASDGYRLAPSAGETERMKRVLEFTLANFRDEIRIEQIASVAGMAPAAFCRYFKRRTRKPFVEYLNELRISHARKLLSEADIPVGQAGLESGFNNISHFHRQFRQHTGMTPLTYQLVSRGK
ncbi:AraC family transcriptional regulator [Spirosoma sp. 209]|uniref:AraC family transcriptional regulator n=1 Tax=Spirosoma sp. 209 TaxID=1955701 RepID=UPI00098D11C6|nr:AraC family transcriptional regulator [Spirosoma sp. 209]